MSNNNFKKNSDETFVHYDEALQKLKIGNQRFQENLIGLDSLLAQSRREEHANKPQRPFAIILSCSDSRAPAEMIFNQGIGDLFIIRVAGNIVAPSLVGSIEFAATTFGTQLVVVMGHSQCGAVKATLDFMEKGKDAPSENIQDIIKRIKPNIQNISLPKNNPEKSLTKAIRANTLASANQLVHSSQIIENLIMSKKLKIVSAEYCLSSGKVDFFEELDNESYGK